MNYHITRSEAKWDRKRKIRMLIMLTTMIAGGVSFANFSNTDQIIYDILIATKPVLIWIASFMVGAIWAGVIFTCWYIIIKETIETFKGEK